MISLAQAWKEEGIEIGILDGVKIGKQEGIKLGEARGKAEIAKKMLAKGRTHEEIIEFTGLSTAEIEGLKS